MATYDHLQLFCEFLKSWSSFLTLFVNFRSHDHSNAVAQNCKPIISGLSHLCICHFVCLCFCLNFVFVVARVLVFAEDGTNQGDGNTSVYVFVLVFVFFFVFTEGWCKPIISGLHHLLWLSDTFTSILRDALPSLSGPPAIM